MDSAPARISLRDIARAGGVSVATVAHAINGTGRVSAPVRERIRALAREMGYQRDPSLRALQTYKRSKHRSPSGYTIAYLTTEDFNPRSTQHARRAIQDTARLTARELGYGLEVFNPSNLSQARLGSILEARNVQGLIIGECRGLLRRLRFDWKRYYTLAVGHSVVYPPVDRIAHNHFAGVGQIWHQLRHRGYRRIGFILDAHNFLYGGKPAVASHKLEQDWSQSHLGFEPLPWLETDRPEVIDAYIREHRPDAVIGLHRVHLCLGKLGWKIPEEVGFAHLSTGTAGINSGIVINGTRIGEEAVSFIDRSLRYNRRGMPEYPSTMLIDGVWNEGANLPSRREGHTRSKKA